MSKDNLSLGDMLRQRIESDKTDKRLKMERDAREKGEKAEEALRVVTEFFEAAKVTFANAIVEDRKIKPIQVGRRENVNVASILYTYASTQVDRAGHQYYPVWADFAKWADDNGLVAEWRYENDGVGMESWHMLSVNPKPQV